MPTTTRARLTRDRIADAAVAYIDDHGLDALSMRKLGAELDVEAMSLYNHVVNKDDLLSAVTDRLYAEVLEDYGDGGDGWRSKARRMAQAYRAAADRHPNAVPLLIDKPVEAAEGLEFMSRIVSIFDELTDDLEQAAMAFHIAGSWVIGTIVQEHGMMKRLAEGEGVSADTVPPQYLPIVRFKEACVDASSPDERFDEGLETILDGLEQRYFA